ncbi:MAG: TonB-dependent receptor [Bacteroidales bacterium]|nr:TonB-dependent receptor [Bacteroidales bacterium]
MKLTLLFSFLIFSSVWAETYSQTTKLNLNLKNATVQNFIKEIEDQTGCLFLYQDEVVDKNRRITIEAKDETLESVLKKFGEQVSVVAEIAENQIILKKAPLYLNLPAQQPLRQINGIVTSSDGQPLPGVTVVVKGTTTGTVTNDNGEFSLSIPATAETLVFSFVGMRTQEVTIGDRTTFSMVMEEETIGMEEVVVVGYGTQKKSDITGTVASLSKERLEMVPNLNIAQAIQGSIPGVMIQTTSAGASPDQVIMVRGRNSIKASNNPLIVVDGIPYEGNIRDINPNDVLSIEILKDASSAAIYGSRGSNGVILVTTKEGREGRATLSYDGYYSTQRFTDLPEVMDGAEFYEFKMNRVPHFMTQEEKAIYEAGTWENWYDLLLRHGTSQQHNLSVSGGTKDTKYYISGGLLDVKGLTLNDNYFRVSNRINVETKIRPWLSLGTRTQFSYDDRSGVGPSWSNAYNMNPLTKAYDDEGKINIYPWEGNFYFANPLQGLLYDNINESFQVVTNNFAIVDIPFISGLTYRINTGFRFRFSDSATYRGRNTKAGLDVRGSSDTNRSRYNNSVIENILTYNKDIGVHTIFATGVYSYEGNKNSSNLLSARAFPHDILSWYSATQAELISPDYTYNETNLISQMLRLNYSYDSRYLLTLTSRRDGYSGFGAATKWGIFPSAALGWNLANEVFFPFSDLFNELKLRASWGLNGNQAVGAYETISRLEEYNMVDAKITIPGYRPSVLGQDNLGWEASRTLNFGLDYGLLGGRISGDFNFYKTRTKDLLLDRTISPVHGISSITQNIGETENIGFELSFNSRNIVSNDFSWSTSGNMAFVKNKIISLYGMLDDEGNEVDDVANAWFIGKPIRVNYDYVWIGTWQLDEADEAEKYGSQPGFVKLKDVDGNYIIDAVDKEIIGQRDPKLLWGLTNSFSYKNFKFDIFIHGIHGVTLRNSLMSDNVLAEARQNTMKKDWWTPENPTNEWVMNHINAEIMGGINANGRYYQNASFVRIKDVSFSYDFPTNLNEKIGFERIRLYVTGRNLFTFTDWIGLDPELSNQRSSPMQKEYVLGVNLSF